MNNNLNTEPICNYKLFKYLSKLNPTQLKIFYNLLMSLAEEQIKSAFLQSEKEVTDLHTRISQSMRESKKKGNKIGLIKHIITCLCSFVSALICIELNLLFYINAETIRETKKLPKNR